MIRAPATLFRDPIVCRRFAAHIVLGLQAIDGDDHIDVGHLLPTTRDDTEGARHNLHVNPTVHQFGNQHFKFTIPDEGVAADNGKMKGFGAIYYVQNAVN